MSGVEVEEWQRRLQERTEESRRRRAARAAVRREMAVRRRKGMELRMAEKLIRADLEARAADFNAVTARPPDGDAQGWSSAVERCCR